MKQHKLFKEGGIFISATLIFTLCAHNAAQAQTTNSDLDDLRNSMMSQFDAQRDNFNKEADALVAEYEAYREKLMAEYSQHCEVVKGKWGDSKVVESEPKQWVEYNDDLSERSVVDFESGKVKVEILLDPSEVGDKAAIERKLEGAVENLITSQGKTTNYKSQYEPQEIVSDRPILASMLNTAKYGVSLSEEVLKGKAAPQPQVGGSQSAAPQPQVGGSAPMPTLSGSATLERQQATEAPKEESEEQKRSRDKSARKESKKEEIAVAPQPITPTTTAPQPTTTPQPAIAASTPSPQSAVTATEAAKTIVEETKYDVQKVVDDKGAEKVVVTIDLALNTNHISDRASEYSATINKNAERFGVEHALIYSIMEQESAFNPMAKSWIPAYGLMQLVPSSGGRDAYNYVFKKDELPSAEYLYKAANNIELGTAYLRLCRDRYFSKVENAKSQMLCIIASYNAGAGGLSRAINGTTNIFKAIPTINAMSYDDLYAMLRKGLPAETQDYIYKVTRNYDKYTSK